MRFVYAVVLSDHRFLMVFNPERGWEMPGGTIRRGETAEEAVVREVTEETGLRFEPLARTNVRDGLAFAGRVRGSEGQGEFRHVFFDRLPEGVAFDRSEYEAIVRWAREAISPPKD